MKEVTVKFWLWTLGGGGGEGFRGLRN